MSNHILDLLLQIGAIVARSQKLVDSSLHPAVACNFGVHILDSLDNRVHQFSWPLNGTTGNPSTGSSYLQRID